MFVDFVQHTDPNRCRLVGSRELIPTLRVPRKEPIADGIPVYLVKNMRTSKIKVLHRIRLLLWLTEYGKPVRCNLAGISDTLPGTIPEEQLSGSGDGVPMQERVMYGTNLAMYRAVVDNP